MHLTKKAAKALRRLQTTGKIANANVGVFLDAGLIERGSRPVAMDTPASEYRLTERGRDALATGVF